MRALAALGSLRVALQVVRGKRVAGRGRQRERAGARAVLVFVAGLADIWELAEAFDALDDAGAAGGPGGLDAPLGAAALAAGADVLVYEAMRFERIRQRPPHLQFILDYHADTPRIGAQAAELGVPILVLTHLIPPPESDDDVQAFVDDIRTAGYAGELVVAEDLSQVTLG